jgi:hypothetical protein
MISRCIATLHNAYPISIFGGVRHVWQRLFAINSRLQKRVLMSRQLAMMPP